MTPTLTLAISLLLYPTLGLFLGYLTRNAPWIRRIIFYPILVIGLIAIVAGVLDISTIDENTNMILYSCMYLSISLGLWYIFFKKSRIIGAFLMLIVFIAGFLGTFTVPLFFNKTVSSKIIVPLDKGLIYKENLVATEYMAKEIEIYKVYNNFFEKKIYSKVYNNDSPAFANDTLAIEYDRSHRKLYLAIPQKDEINYIYTFHKNFDLNWRDTISIPLQAY